MTDESDDNPDYAVGYGKPPVATRFKKGESGNRSGRPKPQADKASLGKELVAAMSELITVTENGRQKKITKLQAALKQISNKAALGDTKSLRLLVQLNQQLVAGEIVRPIQLFFDKEDKDA